MKCITSTCFTRWWEKERLKGLLGRGQPVKRKEGGLGGRRRSVGQRENIGGGLFENRWRANIEGGSERGRQSGYM